MVAEVVDQAPTGVSQEAHQAASEGLASVLARIDELRLEAKRAEAMLSQADSAAAKAKWAGKETVKARQASERALSLNWECSAALELAPSKLREGLRDFWEAERTLEEALAAAEEEEAQEGREAELAPLEAAFGRPRAEAHLIKEYALPEVGSMGSAFPVGEVRTVIRPEWFVTLHIGLPRRRARIVAVGKLLAGLSSRVDADLEKTSRKLAAQP